MLRIPALAAFVSAALVLGGPRSDAHRAPSHDVDGTTLIAATAAAPEAGRDFDVHAEEDDPDDSPRGSIHLDASVVAMCPAVRDMHPTADESLAWLRAMRAVAACTSEGALVQRRLVLRGPARPQRLAMSLFTRLGVDEARVASSAPVGACDDDDDCDASLRRVEIGLAGDDARM